MGAILVWRSRQKKSVAPLQINRGNLPPEPIGICPASHSTGRDKQVSLNLAPAVNANSHKELSSRGSQLACFAEAFSAFAGRHFQLGRKRCEFVAPLHPPLLRTEIPVSENKKVFVAIPFRPARVPGIVGLFLGLAKTFDSGRTFAITSTRIRRLRTKFGCDAFSLALTHLRVLFRVVGRQSVLMLFRGILDVTVA